MRSIAKLAFASLFALGAAACGPKLAPPPAFGALDGGAYDYRAATPQGVVVAARSEKNKPHADLDFWSRAVDARLAREGYVKARRGRHRDRSRTKGVELVVRARARGADVRLRGGALRRGRARVRRRGRGRS